MNGITRVLVSVLLLGVCAAAMRFTMDSVNMQKTKRQLLTANLETKKAKKIELKIQAYAVERFHLKPSQAGRIAGTYDFLGYSAFLESSFKITDSTAITIPREKDVQYVSYNASSYSRKSFYFDSPSTFGVAELRLPKQIPLSISFSMEDYPERPRAFIDLRGLEIDSFSSGFPGSRGLKQLQLNMARGNPTTQYRIHNDTGTTTIDFDQLSQGSMSLNSESGQISIRGLGAVSNIGINVYITADNANEVRNRLSLTNSGLVWGNPRGTSQSNLWVVSEQTENATKDPFYLELRLGKNARVSL